MSRLLSLSGRRSLIAVLGLLDMTVARAALDLPLAVVVDDDDYDCDVDSS